MQDAGRAALGDTDQDVGEVGVRQTALPLGVAGFGQARLLLDQAQDLESPERLVDLEVGEKHLTAQAFDTLVALFEAHDEQLFTLAESHPLEGIAPVLAQPVHRAWRADALPDARERANAPDAGKQQLSGADVQGDQLVRRQRSFFEVVFAFFPRKQIEHDPLDLEQHAVDEVFGG